MPSDLNKLYTKTLERVNQQVKNFRTLAYHVLLWLSQVRRPLLVRELRQAITV